jgi:type II secretory pathway component PulF
MKYKVSYQENQKIESIIIEAKNKNELKNSPDFPKNSIKIKEYHSFKINWSLVKTNNKKQTYELFSSLNMMLHSNLTLHESIELLLQTKQEKTIIQILQAIQQSLKTSKSISIALKSYRYYLGDTAILFLNLGLENGNIKESIDSLVQLLQEDIKTSEKLKDILRYPTVLLISLAIAFSMIFIYVLPNFEFVFNLLEGDMPLSTQSLLFVKNFINNYFVLVIFSLVLFVLIISFFYKRYRLFFDKLVLLKIPVFSVLLQSYFFYKLFLAICIIVKSKYQFQTAIKNTRDIINNQYIKNTIDKILINITNGSQIAKAFEDTGLFDEFTIKLLYMAQYTNNYELILNDIAAYHKKRFKNSLKNFSSFIDPVLIFFIAMVVLWLVLSIMQPIWQMSSIIQ